MKNLLLILFSFIILSSCSQNKVEKSFDVPGVSVSMNDELNSRVFKCDSTLNARDMEFAAYKDSVRKSNPLLVSNCDSISDKLFIANYKLEKINYYLKICLKNPTQDKFLKGWIRRALN